MSFIMIEIICIVSLIQSILIGGTTVCACVCIKYSSANSIRLLSKAYFVCACGEFIQIATLIDAFAVGIIVLEQAVNLLIWCSHELDKTLKK